MIITEIDRLTAWCFMQSTIAAVTDCDVERAADDDHTVQPPLLGQLTSEAAKRTVVLCGIKKGTDTQAVEKLAGNLTRVRQLRYPVVMQDVADDLCAAVIYRGKRDALKAAQRLKSQTLAGFTLCFLFTVILCCTPLTWKPWTESNRVFTLSLRSCSSKVLHF